MFTSNKILVSVLLQLLNFLSHFKHTRWVQLIYNIFNIDYHIIITKIGSN